MDLRLRSLVPAGLAVAAAACTLLPWWRARWAPVLLVDGPSHPLPADEWSGVELLGTPIAVGLGVLAVGAAALAVIGCSGDHRENDVVGDPTPRTSFSVRSSGVVAAAVGGAAAAGAGRVLVVWGPSGAVGAWLAGLVGLAAVAAALVRPPAAPTPAADDRAARRRAAGRTTDDHAPASGQWAAAHLPVADDRAAASARAAAPAPAADDRAALIGRQAAAPAPVSVADGRAERRRAAGRLTNGSSGSLTVLAAALVGGLVVGLLSATDAPPAAADGPFGRLADLAQAGPLRSGATALPAPSDLRLTVVDGAVAAVTDDGIATFGHGRVSVLARVPPDDRGRHVGGILGVADGRVARFVDASTVLVTGLEPGDPIAVRITGVAEASPVGSDGTAWLRGYGEAAATIRTLDLSAYPDSTTLDVTFLPLVTIDAPVGSDPVEVRHVLPVPGGALRRTGRDGELRVERIAAEPGRIAVTPVAGGLDPTCGLTAAARSASLPALGPFAAAPDGGAWLAADGRLLRVDADGVLRVVRAPLPGNVTALVTAPDGSVVLATQGDALWSLRPTAPLDDLPPTPSDCVPDPRAAGPPVSLVPVANTGTDRLGTPLGVDGRWAGSTRDGHITAVSADGRTRTPLGDREDGGTGPVLPDGAGGVWWLESGADGLTLVHGRPGATPLRLPPVGLPADRAVLIPDLGGRAPLLATPTGAFRVSAGSVDRVVEGSVTGGVVRADGRGWLLEDGRLVALDGDRVLGPVIDGTGISGRVISGRGIGAAVAVQLAKNVPPDRLALPGASIALDARGRAIVLSDGVVLAVTVDGGVAAVAQDARLTAPLTVEGGLVQRGDDGALLRVDLPG